MPEIQEDSLTLCHECDRSGRGNAKDKCACGWKITKPGPLGCFLGTPIVGEPRNPEKVSRSKRRYADYLDMCECFDDFAHFLRWKEAVRKGEVAA